MPMTALVCVMVAWPLASARAMPKSMTLTWLVSESITLPGLTSRWMMWCLWLKSRAAHMSATTSQATAESKRPSAMQDLFEGAAVDELHHHVGDAGVFAGVEDGDDVGVVQGGGVLGLALESDEERLVTRQVGSQQFHRDVAAESQVAAAVDFCHPAVADDLADLVSAAEQAGLCRHRVLRPRVPFIAA